MTTATGVVALDSDIARKRWMRQGMVQAASMSFWSPFTGMNKDSVIYQVSNGDAGSGHTVVFDMDGNLSGKAVKGKDTMFGKGEQKRKFSDKIDVDRYRLGVNNGDMFDAVNIGDLSITQHSDSRAKLSDLFIRFKDQMVFDTLQSFHGNAPTHSIQIDASTNAFSYNHLVEIEERLRTGTGYNTGSFGSTATAETRAPLKPYKLMDGRPVWILVVDPFTASNIKGNLGAGGLMQLATSADIRGRGNMIFKGLIGKIGSLVIVEAERFFGESTGKDFNDSNIEIAGMRQFDSDKDAWTGESGFVTGDYSRNLILGGCAMQLAFGKQPDYKFQASQDFGITSESAVEFWTNAKKVKLKMETGDSYKDAKVAELDYGVIALDIKLV